MSNRSEPIAPTEADIERLAAQLRLPIAAESRAAVAQHLGGLLTAARLVDEFVLPETVEPAPPAAS